VAGDRDIKLGGASPRKQALAAGLCDEILIHLAPYLLGGGVRLFESLPDGIELEKLSVSDGPVRDPPALSGDPGRSVDMTRRRSG
jgi:dihydrofolate reductase